MKIMIAAFLFVMLYGSGFVATEYGLPFVDPMTFLVMRFALTACILGALCLYIRPKLPNRKDIMHTFFAGMLISGLFSLGVFLAIAYGLSASTTALIISFQPLIASVIAKVFYDATVTIAQWLGLIIGLLGVLVIVFWGLESPSLLGLVMAGLGLLGVAFGSVYQKYYCANMHLVFGGFIQNVAAFVLCALVYPLYGTHFLIWSPEFVFALLWMAIGLSIGGITLMYILIRHLSVSKMSTLFYLIPIAALVLSLLFLDGRVSLVQSVGIVLVSVSIFLVTYFDQRQAKRAYKPPLTPP